MLILVSCLPDSNQSIIFSSGSRAAYDLKKVTRKGLAVGGRISSLSEHDEKCRSLLQASSPASCHRLAKQIERFLSSMENSGRSA